MSSPTPPTPPSKTPPRNQQRICSCCGQDFPLYGPGTLLPHTRHGIRTGMTRQLDSTMRDGLGIAGLLAGGGFGGYYGFNGIMHRVQRMIPGRGILQLWIGVPLTIVCAAASAGFGYGAMPLFALTTLRAYHTMARGIEGLGRDSGLDDASMPRDAAGSRSSSNKSPSS